MCDSYRPHGLQPTRLLRPWDFPGKNTGVGCHFLNKGKSELEESQGVWEERGGVVSEELQCLEPRVSS